MKTQFYFDNLNDSQKQRLAETMLDKHPIRLNNSIVEYILLQDDYENTPFNYDDITNNEPTGSITINGFCDELTESERDEKLEIYQYLVDKADSIISKLNDLQSESDSPQWEIYQAKIDKFEPTQTRLQTVVDDLESMDFEDYPEIYQWFSCDGWLIHKLELQGQCTLDNEFWGRQCCGQSVILDHVIQQIAFERACDYEKDYLTLEQVEAICEGAHV